MVLYQYYIYLHRKQDHLHIIRHVGSFDSAKLLITYCYIDIQYNIHLY